MQVEYKTTIGTDEFTIRVDVQDGKEFFEKLSFFTTLPKVGPNGETDLKLTYTHTQDGYDYYSLVSEQAGQEFKYGQRKSDQALFPKGWAPLYQAEESEEKEVVQKTVAPAKTTFKKPIEPIAKLQTRNSSPTENDDENCEEEAYEEAKPVAAKSTVKTPVNQANPTSQSLKERMARLSSKYGVATNSQSGQ